jgi:hypothetical protein
VQSLSGVLREHLGHLCGVVLIKQLADLGIELGSPLLDGITVRLPGPPVASSRLQPLDKPRILQTQERSQPLRQVERLLGWRGHAKTTLSPFSLKFNR